MMVIDYPPVRPPYPRGARRGITLTEVLMAIFIMAIGMLSLLALFPVGMMNMRQAIQDDRIASATSTAINNAEAVQVDPLTNVPFNLRSEPNYLTASQFVPDLLGNALFRWYSNGYTFPTLPTPSPLDRWAYDLQNGHRPPVYVDSLGVLAYPGPTPADPTGFFRWGFGLGSRNNAPNLPDALLSPLLPPPGPTNTRSNRLYGIPRVRSSHITGVADAIRACVHEDEMTFEKNGQPPLTGVERENRYSWAYMCRFPKGDDPSVVDMSIVLYNGRRLSAAPNDLTSGEMRYLGNPNYAGLVFTRGSNVAVIDLYEYNAGTPPNPLQPAPTASPFKKGDYILDNTLMMPDFFQYPSSARYYAPFLYSFSPTPNITPPNVDPATGMPATTAPIRSGLANGFFYKIIHVGPVTPVTNGPGANHFIQELTLDRAALADGFEAVYLRGVVDVIEKSNGRTPMR